MLKRPELTWITSSVCIIAFCGVAWWLAGRARGNAPRMNQLDIVDIDVSSQQLRGTSWLHLYSPTSRNFDLTLQPASLPVGEDGEQFMLFGWQGVPGKSMSGMNRDSRADHGGAEYLLTCFSDGGQADQFSIDALSLPAAGSKALAARWSATSTPMQDFEFRQVDGKKLVGHVTNPLSVSLTNCWLYHDRWVYQLGNLDAGQRAEFRISDSPRDSEWALTERRFVDANDVASPWDQAMRDDVPKIVRMMMFHEVANGRNHTQQLNRDYGYLDMTGHLKLDRAVLFGMAEKPATQVVTDGQPLKFDGDKRWTFYRIVYPVVPLN